MPARGESEYLFPSSGGVTCPASPHGATCCCGYTRSPLCLQAKIIPIADLGDAASGSVEVVAREVHRNLRDAPPPVTFKREGMVEVGQHKCWQCRTALRERWTKKNHEETGRWQDRREMSCAGSGDVWYDNVVDVL